jgi:N-acyl-D-aspartate/D-glutamate deacylase
MPVSRRDFISLAGLAAAGLAFPAAAPALHLPHRRRYDLVLRGGTLFDGTGAPGVVADVAVRGGRVAAVGARLAEAGAEEIDLRGLAVAPGFVDIHSHADGTVMQDPMMESVIRQGVTTVIVGQDGGSAAPRSRGGNGAFTSMAQLLAAIDRLPPAANVASMVGLGTVRGTVVGADDRPATPDELRRMIALVESALADGACGVSTGLEYTPGAFASQAELIELARPAARRGLVYSTHMRNEDDRLLDALAEAVAVARGAGCALQVSHLKTQGPRNWGKLDDAFALLERAAGDGVDVAFDRYPYVAYQTGLTSLFPVWSRDGGTTAFLARVDSASVGARVKEATLAKVALIGGWDNVQVTSVREPADKGAEGQRLGSYARGRGEDPYTLAVALLRRSRGDVGMVGFAMSEDNVDRILAHPRGMVCSDGGAFAVSGPARRGHPHPRGLGTFPRVLARYVRERKALTLEQAVRKMSALPAARARLADRGRVAVGLAADLVAFDPATVRDRATFEAPYQYPEGISLVVVNGGVALRDGQRPAGRRGRTLRPSAPAAAPVGVR